MQTGTVTGTAELHEALDGLYDEFTAMCLRIEEIAMGGTINILRHLPLYSQYARRLAEITDAMEIVAEHNDANKETLDQVQNFKSLLVAFEAAISDFALRHRSTVTTSGSTTHHNA